MFCVLRFLESLAFFGFVGAADDFIRCIALVKASWQVESTRVWNCMLIWASTRLETEIAGCGGAHL